MTADDIGRSLTRLKMVLTQWAPKEIDRDLCLIWLNVLKDFTDQQIKDAFLKAATELTEWPAPATIKRLCQGCNKTDEENGQEIASRIEGAIIKYGYSSIDKARQFIGELGWHVVTQCGGWVSVCEVETDQLPSSRKQWRDLATIVSKNFFTNGDNLPPGLPERRNPVLAAALKLAIGGGEEQKLASG
jgi:hypothetical protein